MPVSLIRCRYPLSSPIFFRTSRFQKSILAEFISWRHSFDALNRFGHRQADITGLILSRMMNRPWMWPHGEEKRVPHVDEELSMRKFLVLLLAENLPLIVKSIKESNQSKTRNISRKLGWVRSANSTQWIWFPICFGLANDWLIPKKANGGRETVRFVDNVPACRSYLERNYMCSAFGFDVHAVYTWDQRI